MANYYKEQLDKTKNSIGKEFEPVIKIQAESGNTNWLTLNNECANTLYHWLKENFNITEL